MKKMFILFLMVALVPFAVGCFGGGSDNDAVDYTTVTKVVNMPADVVSGGESLRAAVSFKKFKLYLNNHQLTAGEPTINADGVSYDVPFTISLPSSVVSSELVGKSVSAKITVNTGTEVTYISFTYTPTSSATSDKITVTVNASLQPIGVSIVSNGLPVTPTGVASETVDLTAYKFNVTSATYNSEVLATVLADAKAVATLTPAFDLTFSADPTNLAAASWELIVTSVNPTTGAAIASYTLKTSTDSAIFSITAGADANKAVVKVLGSTTETAKNLSNGKTYKVQVSKNNLKSGEKLLDTPKAYFFKVVLP
ncbi:MAG TPA: hypothetical protein DCG57_03345 [Candidatus Riflebacteria bacterium]|jgi:hypothetical protein|nr:hypothetical protein [Candidatus Riflebacteria bacterium]